MPAAAAQNADRDEMKRRRRGHATAISSNPSRTVAARRRRPVAAEIEAAATALKQSEERFRDFAMTSSDWLWETDAEHRFTYLSENVQKLGANPSQYLGKTRFECAGDIETDPEKWRAHCEALTRHEPFQNFVYRREGSIGGANTASVSGVPLFDAKGQFTGYRGTARDITAEMQALEALQRANVEAEAARAEADRLRQTAEETNRYLLEAQRIGKLGHWVSDEVAGTVTWSPQMFEITGLPPQSVMSLDLSRIPPVHPEDVAAFFAVRERALASGKPETVEVRYVRRPNDEVRWVHVEMQAYYDEAGQVVRLFGTTQDITERKQAEDDLKAARTQLLDAIEAMSEGFALFDRDDRYVMTNSNYLRFYPDRTDLFAPGTRYEDMLRGSIARGRELSGDDPEAWVRRMVEWHQTCGEPLERQGPDGRWIRQVEQRTSDGGIVAIRTDITAQVTAQNALREALREAQAASIAKSQFLANMSHELRTPLNGIIGFSEMIKLAIGGPLPPNYQEYGGLIHQSGEHLLAVINDILDLAKADAGKFELRREEGVDPRRIAEACMSLVRTHADIGGIRLSLVTGDDPLPMLVADPTRLKQILFNLLSNAIKFTKSGGGVTLGVRRSEDGGAVFEVQDTGFGMTPSEIETALEPFGQVRDSSLHPQEGTGLGLPLARQFTELHGGSLRIDSEKGCGTTVTVTLPVRSSEDSEQSCAIARTAGQLAAAELAATRPARLPAPATASG
ncbi:MAG: ATP-binding protein [Stellaceae bacterium]